MIGFLIFLGVCALIAGLLYKANRRRTELAKMAIAENQEFCTPKPPQEHENFDDRYQN